MEMTSPFAYAHLFSAQPSGEATPEQPRPAAPAETDGDSTTTCLRSEPLSAAKRRNHRQITTLRARQRRQAEKPYPNNHAERPQRRQMEMTSPFAYAGGRSVLSDPPKPSGQRSATPRQPANPPTSEPTNQRTHHPAPTKHHPAQRRQAPRRRPPSTTAPA